MWCQREGSTLGAMAALEIRPYAPQDLDALRRIGEEILADGSVFPFESLQGVLDHWLAPGLHTFVACLDGEVLGSYELGPNRPDRGSHVANAGYMVAQSARGRGVGQAMGEHSLELARSLGYRAMQFNQVVSTNLSAVRLWQRIGFRIVGEVPEAFRHPSLGLVSVYVMYREL